MADDYPTWFEQATGHPPFPYQVALAEATPGGFPSILRAPTGAGKTAAVSLAWLWRRRCHPDPEVRKSTPRRLAYCLPMRTLVEQTHDTIECYLNALDLADGEDSLSLHLLMGGAVDRDWALHPEKEAILVGTQDMLLSRALNRGYGASRFRWPVEFGLLHNDTLWVADEVQIMGPGLETSAQLEGFRRAQGTVEPSASLWVSATVDPQWLNTVDLRGQEVHERVMDLGAEDREREALKKRLHAPKTLHRPSLEVPPTKSALKQFQNDLSDAVAEHHQPGSRTLVILNTVDRARELYATLRDRLGDGDVAPPVLLLHSRFREPDRKRILSRIREEIPPPGLIAVTTQVVEAGIDISSATLFTELCPWASLVQRLGRLNRYGEQEEGRAFVIDVDAKASAPYDEEDMEAARRITDSLVGKSVAPADLPKPGFSRDITHVLRSRDMDELFDTTPDLTGNDLDISRFIRDADESDVLVFWRDLPEGAPDSDAEGPERREIVRVPIGQMANHLKTRKAWIWDHLAGEWRRCPKHQVRPGNTLMLDSAEGGYREETGWTPRSRKSVPVLNHVHVLEREATDEDPSSFTGSWISLVDHTNHVCEELDRILKALDGTDLTAREVHALRRAARWHDRGKAHPVFQATLQRASSTEPSAPAADQAWAKSPGRGARHSRRHFRHELASALAYLQSGEAQDNGDPLDTNLSAYLIAAHHGKIRGAIRSFPNETEPEDPSVRVAVGIHEGDLLPAVDLGDGIRAPEASLSLEVMELGLTQEGEPSWTERTSLLLEKFGPFRLGWLEAVLRCADMRASAAEWQQERRTDVS